MSIDERVSVFNALVDKGFRVHPIHFREKSPLFSGWQEYSGKYLVTKTTTGVDIQSANEHKYEKDFSIGFRAGTTVTNSFDNYLCYIDIDIIDTVKRNTNGTIKDETVSAKLKKEVYKTINTALSQLGLSKEEAIIERSGGQHRGYHIPFLSPYPLVSFKHLFSNPSHQYIQDVDIYALDKNFNFRNIVIAPSLGLYQYHITKGGKACVTQEEILDAYTSIPKITPQVWYNLTMNYAEADRKLLQFACLNSCLITSDGINYELFGKIYSAIAYTSKFNVDELKRMTEETLKLLRHPDNTTIANILKFIDATYKSDKDKLPGIPSLKKHITDILTHNRKLKEDQIEKEVNDFCSFVCYIFEKETKPGSSKIDKTEEITIDPEVFKDLRAKVWDSPFESRDRNWIVPGLFAEDQSYVFYSAAGLGKTTLTTKMMLDIVQKDTMFDGLYLIPKNVPILHFVHDISGSEQRDIVKKLNDGKVPDGYNILHRGAIEVILERDQDKSIPFNITSKTIKEMICGFIEDCGAKIVIFDSIYGFHDKDENKSEIKEVTKALKEIASTKHVAVLGIHHTRKQQKQFEQARVTQDDMIGSSMWSRDAHALYAISPMFDEVTSAKIEGKGIFHATKRGINGSCTFEEVSFEMESTFDPFNGVELPEVLKIHFTRVPEPVSKDSDYTISKKKEIFLRGVGTGQIKYKDLCKVLALKAKFSLSTIDKYARELKELGLVEAEGENKDRVYKLTKEGREFIGEEFNNIFEEKTELTQDALIQSILEHKDKFTHNDGPSVYLRRSALVAAYVSDRFNIKQFDDTMEALDEQGYFFYDANAEKIYLKVQNKGDDQSD
jgi:predicted transcriptional regulator